MSEAMQRVLRGLGAGSDPTKLLHDCLQAAVSECGAKHGVLSGVMNGQPVPLASLGLAHPTLDSASSDAARTGRLSRNSDRSTGVHAIAQPIRVGSRLVGTLAVAGTMDQVDPAPLLVLADLAALAISRRPTETSDDPAALLDAAAGIAAIPSADGVVAAGFDALEHHFDIAAGFCALMPPGTRRVVIAHERNVDRARLRAASELPEFRQLLAASSARIETVDHAAVASLVSGTEVAIVLPLRVGNDRLGHLVLLAGETPPPGRMAAITAFASHIALGLRSAEQRDHMRDRDEQLASVVHAVPDAVIVADDLGRFVMANAAASQLFRLAGSFEAGQSVDGRLGHAELEGMLAGRGDGRSVDVMLRTETGSRAFAAVVRSIHGTENRLRGRILVLQDVTTAREAERVKADFIGVIGHELRTPLTVMKGYLGALAKVESMTPERRATAIAALTSNTARLGTLIEDLLLMSALETSGARLVLDEIDLGALASELVVDRVRLEAPRRPVLIEGDESRLQTVLRHLIDNAVKYSDDEVTVKVSSDGDRARIEVIDRGPGIYSGDVTRVFDRFTQLDGSSTRTQGGTGTGLYICHRLVEAMEGRIHCDSRMGQGTTMTVELPVAGPSSALAFDEVTFARS